MELETILIIAVVVLILSGFLAFAGIVKAAAVFARFVFFAVLIVVVALGLAIVF